MFGLIHAVRDYLMVQIELMRTRDLLRQLDNRILADIGTERSAIDAFARAAMIAGMEEHPQPNGGQEHACKPKAGCADPLHA